MRGNFRFFTIIFMMLYVIHAEAQAPVTVSEATVKLGIMSEEILYFGFAKGDQMIFSFDMVSGKDIKELEITEMPSSSRLLEIKPGKIINRIIQVKQTGIFKFRFTSSSVLPRSFTYKIQRIPAGPETQNFNSTVYTETRYDTSYINEIENYIVKDTVINVFRDRGFMIHQASSGNNRVSFNFILPGNCIAWSYYISSGTEAAVIFEETNKSYITGSGDPFLKFPHYNILAALALNQQVSIPEPEKGKMITYWLMDEPNATLFDKGEQFSFLKFGKVTSDYFRMEPSKEALFFGIENTDPDEQVNVTVKITTILINESLKSRQYQKMVLNPVTDMVLKN